MGNRVRSDSHTRQLESGVRRSASGFFSCAYVRRSTCPRTTAMTLWTTELGATVCKGESWAWAQRPTTLFATAPPQASTVAQELRKGWQSFAQGVRESRRQCDKCTES